MKKVFIQTNLPVPYKVDFYNLLGKYCDLTVIFEGRRLLGQKFNWKDDSLLNFKAVYLNEYIEDKCNTGIIKYVTSKKFDIFIISAFYTKTGILTINLLKIKNIPYYFEMDGAFKCLNENAIKYLFKRFLIKGAYGYLSPCVETDNYYKHYGISTNKIFRYPFASTLSDEILRVPLSHEEKLKLRKRLSIKEDKMIISVGQFIHRKGHDILIETLHRINDNSIGCYIIGGDPSQYYLDLKKKYNLDNLYFIPFLNKEDLNLYYQAADIFVFPTREDIWGLVVNEAMSNGLPVITTKKCNAGIEMINGNGEIISVDDVEKLQSVIIKMIHNQKLLFSMSLKSIEIARKYSIEAMVDAHREILLK